MAMKSSVQSTLMNRYFPFFLIFNFFFFFFFLCTASLIHSSRKLSSLEAKTVSYVPGNPGEMRRFRVQGLRVRYRRRKRGKTRGREVVDISLISILMLLNAYACADIYIFTRQTKSYFMQSQLVHCKRT